MKKLKFICERSRVPIYDRLVRNIALTLNSFGHEVYWYTKDQTIYSAMEITKNREDVIWLSTNCLNEIITFDHEKQIFPFELLENPMIVIHHDTSGVTDQVLYHRKLLDSYKLKHKSIIHFMIEHELVAPYRSYGITHTYPINHCTEFNKPPNLSENQAKPVTFIGHLTNRMETMPTSHLHDPHRLLSAAYARLSDCQISIKDFLVLSKSAKANDFGSTRQTLTNTNVLLPGLIADLHAINFFSSPIRGNFISSLTAPITIIGGDLSYGRSTASYYKIDQSNITYQSATSDYATAEDLYNQSLFTINVTSLQFDFAVNNRVVDAIMSGCLPLTDYRPGLESMTTESKRFAYISLSDLHSKVEYYLDPAHLQEKHDLVTYLQEEIKEEINYRNVYQSVINKILKVI
jgi:hypothetical protein